MKLVANRGGRASGAASVAVVVRQRNQQQRTTSLCLGTANLLGWLRYSSARRIPERAALRGARHTVDAGPAEDLGDLAHLAGEDN